VTRKRGAKRADIEAIYRDRFGPFVSSTTALLRDGEAALDVVQEGFARALRKRRSFRADGSLEAWIWRIVLNLARDRQRTLLADRGAPLTGEPRAGASTQPDDSVRARLRTLPARQRMAVFLRYYAGMSYEEIAEVLQVRPGTVAASLNAAHKTLRRQLEEVAR
jgi:RNA polymerase sigma-70 factor (ECF subfamily)